MNLLKLLTTAGVPEALHAQAIAKGIKTVLDELAPVAPHPVSVAPLPALECVWKDASAVWWNIV